MQATQPVEAHFASQAVSTEHSAAHPIALGHPQCSQHRRAGCTKAPRTSAPNRGQTKRSCRLASVWVTRPSWGARTFYKCKRAKVATECHRRHHQRQSRLRDVFVCKAVQTSTWDRRSLRQRVQLVRLSSARYMQSPHKVAPHQAHSTSSQVDSLQDKQR